MKILLTTHGQYGTGIIETLKMFSKPSENLILLELTDDGIDQFESQLSKTLDSDTEWLCLCDLKGGTPFKSCLMYKISNPDKNINILTGVNFPMILEASIWGKSLSLEELTSTILNTGKESIEHTNIKE